jgi:hypothetical protein
MISTPPMRPRTAGLIIGAMMALSLMAWSEILGVQPGQPIAERCDALFQSDAGQRVQDIRRGQSSFGMGSHALVHLLWPRVLHSLAHAFPDQNSASVWIGRITVALAAGIGWGILACGLVRMGIPGNRLILLSPVAMLASSQCLVALPDHFGLSAGLLTASLGVYLLAISSTQSFRHRRSLALLCALTAGVCITNVLLPLSLLIILLQQRYRPAWGNHYYGYFIIIFMIVIAISIRLIERAGPNTPLVWQAKHWLNLRLIREPDEAAKRILRGTVEPVIVSTPMIDTNNLFQHEMVTLESPAMHYELWPYSGWQSIAAASWMIAWIVAVSHGLLSRPARGPTMILMIWIIWNLIFHNLWGDEFYLYSPHYSWALIAILLLNHYQWMMVMMMPILLGQYCSIEMILNALNGLN